MDVPDQAAAGQDLLSVDGFDDDLARSLAQLGPKTTTHRASTASGGTDTAPSFGEWAEKWVAEHVPQVEEKAATYGGNSLAKKGYRFAAAVGQGVDAGQALELGCAQYLVEKADRVEDAILRGQLPTEDTYLDAAVYALMGLYVRTYGRWA